jgi:hypothetical protein
VRYPPKAILCFKAGLKNAFLSERQSFSLVWGAYKGFYTNVKRLKWLICGVSATILFIHHNRIESKIKIK